MKAAVLVLLWLYCSVECRKAYAPIDKNANLAFINMEAGGGARPSPSQAKAAPNSPANPPANPPSSPTNKPIPVTPTQPPVKPITTMVAPTPAKPVAPAAKPTPPAKPSPVKPGSPFVTTPGPGTVKQLVNFYDSQGKGSPIRPYSYSQAVKQG